MSICCYDTYGAGLNLLGFFVFTLLEGSGTLLVLTGADLALARFNEAAELVLLLPNCE